MKLESLIILASLTTALAAPIENQQAKGPPSISLSFSSKELLEALGLGGISVSFCFLYSFCGIWCLFLVGASSPSLMGCLCAIVIVRLL